MCCTGDPTSSNRKTWGEIKGFKKKFSRLKAYTRAYGAVTRFKLSGTAL